jgi:Putative Ig domain
MPGSQTLTASGGAPPYSWSLASGSLPAGLSLSSGGIVSGTPTAAGSFNFTVRVTDTSVAQQTAQKDFSLTIVSVGSPLSITTSSPLPSGIVGTRYSQDIQASGGTPPYRWSIRSGALPQGLTLSLDGVLSGTPTTAGSLSFIIQVTDSRSPQQSAERTFTLTINNAGLPSVTLTGVPGELLPTQQQPIGLALSAPSTSPLSGTLTLSFTPNAVAAADDPMVMFSTGARTVSFSVPANSTVAVFPSPVLLLTGTVAGSINLTASLQGSQPQGIGTVNIRSLPPQVRNVVAVRTSGGLRVEITAYSPERRVQRADFEFRFRTAAGMESVNLSRSVESEFENWYRSPASVAFGSSFLFMQSFAVQGDNTTIETVTITLTNAQGSTSSNVTSFSN